MKVGIITMHKVMNYGSILQAYATQEIVRNLGYDCELIDYDFPNSWQFSRGIAQNKLSLKSRLSKALHLRKAYAKEPKFKRFIRSHFLLSREYHTAEELQANPPLYDIYLTGSDQVWNYKFTKMDPSFFLSFVPADSHKVSFSSSFAVNQIPEELRQEITEKISAYNSISVREQRGQEIVKELIGKEVPVTVDPTLTLDFREWGKLINAPKRKEKYIFLYMLDYAYNPAPYIYELVEHLQKKTGFIVFSNVEMPKSLGIRYHSVADAGIEEFLQLVRDSALVVTSSFHGVAFSVNFGVPLLAVVPQEIQADTRLTSLLEQLELRKSIVRVGSTFDGLDGKYDKDREQRLLSDLRRDSIDYLRVALSN
jgi:hypothetical protein